MSEKTTPQGPLHAQEDKTSSTAGRDNEASARAMSAADEWRPAFDRRQSWSKEDQKHALQMRAVEGVKTGLGFTEKTP
ncbi:hypothetical protein J3459_006555 [Metarhizium acridum]|uniref:uncharacterized protein n=1 Tax=Metarhizium acridum TaxID=92637 RepID=UPI001C6CF629|nr:hypothetical protein J3458_005056 [Metarhizium acridum]KAG8427592.1 hypothetical protein J3459_006555 [Metarhizium acridum]